jgi:hypothetical protein
VHALAPSEPHVVATTPCNTSPTAGIFKASSFYEMLERLWASIFDTLLRMSNMFKERRQGIIFLILNYNHIKATLRAADSSVAQRISSASGSSASGSKGAQQQQQQQPAAPGTAAGGLGSAGAAAIKECEVRGSGIAASRMMCQQGLRLDCVLTNACHALFGCHVSQPQLRSSRSSSVKRRMLWEWSCAQQRDLTNTMLAGPSHAAAACFAPCRTSWLRARRCTLRTSWAATSSSCWSL